MRGPNPEGGFGGSLPEAGAGPRILVVDDEPSNLELGELMLRHHGYREVRAVAEPEAVLDALVEFRPDLVLLDLYMPRRDGFTILEELRSHLPPGAWLPVLVVTADTGRETRNRALQAGATDFITKPFDSVEVLARIRNLLQTRQLHLELDARVRERTRQLEEARLEILERLARVAEFRDDATGQHMRRIASLSALLAESVGLDADEVELIRLAAPLHDIGKVAIPDAVLLKPGTLTPVEFELVKLHTVVGAEILSDSSAPELRLATEIALSHHERWDGRGYPRGLGGEEIPLAGRIVAVVDAFDAITHDRPYRPAQPLETALAEIRRHAGFQFDPDLARVFLALARQLPASAGELEASAQGSRLKRAPSSP